jgi:hypothetical protein
MIKYDGGALLYHGGDEQRSFDSTCRKLHRFLKENRSITPAVTHKLPRRGGKSMALASKHLAVFQPEHATPALRGTCTAAQGLDAETFSRLSARGGVFSLDILFCRTQKGLAGVTWGSGLSLAGA